MEYERKPNSGMGLVNKKAGHNLPASNHSRFCFGAILIETQVLNLLNLILLHANKSAYQIAHPQSDHRIG